LVEFEEHVALGRERRIGGPFSGGEKLRDLAGEPRPPARPIITASAPEAASISRASSNVSRSPLAATGILTAAFTRAIAFQSARPS
jgi:hypothetical protein